MKKTCVLFIHGLGGNKEDTWGDLSSILNEKKNSSQSDEFDEIDLKYFEYESTKFTNFDGFSKEVLTKLFKELCKSKDDKNQLPSQIHSESKALRAHLSRDEYLDYESIFIIAHSMGGLISARYLLDEISERKPIKIKRILYICTPFLGSVFANIAVTLGFASDETKNMRINSNFIRELREGVQEIEEVVDSTYFFGVKDKVIEAYSDTVGYDSQKMLNGDHSSLLKEENLKVNFEHIKKFILDMNYDTFIEKLYTRAISNNGFKYNNSFERKIVLEESLKKFQGNHLQKALLNRNELENYQYMMGLISNHYYTPHEIYHAEKYYVKIDSNENIMEIFWNDINSKEKLSPWFYIGSRGSGKTLLQNMWLKKHFKEMEDRKIFHVRCDVHKIFDLMRKSLKEPRPLELSIDTYLDMQFLYILLKYRSCKFNNKGNNKQGVTSSLMQSIYEVLDRDNTDVIKGSRFNNLGDFLEKQSEFIKHNEVNLRPTRRRYSYAIELMGNISTGKNIIKDILEDYEGFSSLLLEKKPSEKLDILLGYLDDYKRSAAKEKIISTIKRNELKSKNLKISDMETTLIEIDEEVSASKKNTTALWLRISKHIQEFILSRNYKILKMIDGIDNIIVQDFADKKLYEEKMEEVNNLINKGNRKFVYYFISLRTDSFIDIRKLKEAKTYETGNVGSSPLGYCAHRHEDAGESLSTIITKRYEAFNSLRPSSSEDSLYYKILSHVFNNYNDDPVNKVKNIIHIRAILRQYMFISLHVLFEFKRKKIFEFNKEFCNKIADRIFEEVFFLRNKLYICTDEVTGNTRDNKYKIFPNVFYANHKSKEWTGFCSSRSLCRIRILQLLKNNSIKKDIIVNTLNTLYPVEYIEKKIIILLSYNLIETSFDEKSKTLNYKTTYKGNYLLDIIRSNLNIIYYFCLDTPLPEKFIHEEDSSENSYLSIFLRTTAAHKKAGYGNSIIKTVLTFILYIKDIHDSEVLTLNKSSVSCEDIRRLSFPLDIEDVEKKLKPIFISVIRDNVSLYSYFRHIGYYKTTEELEKDLTQFSWHK